MTITYSRLAKGEVVNLLNIMSPQFHPPLVDTLNLDTYAEKLSLYAHFLLYHISNDIIGSIVYYLNYNTSIAYIPIVWVNNSNRGQGVAKKMFDSFFKMCNKEDFLYSDLEVIKSNSAALQLYISLGYRVLEDRNEKYLMRKFF